jgi:hypothetical protein
MSNTNKLTFTSMSSMLHVFLERVDKTWKGSNCFVFLFMATISQSSMNDFMQRFVSCNVFLEN